MSYSNGSAVGRSGWFDDDDVDDEDFLKNSRNPQSSKRNDNLSQQNHVAQMMARREAIEDRTLKSTERSLTMLRESEKVGVETAHELAAQREQLERTSRNLDDINATLRSTQRNIDGIKSVFTSLRNYITGPKDVPPVAAARTPTGDKMVNSQSSSQIADARIPTQRVVSEDPVTKPATAQQAIDRNLSFMSDTVTNLRGLALNLGDEILEQNEILDVMQYKADKAGDTISKQNTQINRLLGKK